LIRFQVKNALIFTPAYPAEQRPPPPKETSLKTGKNFTSAMFRYSVAAFFLLLCSACSSNPQARLGSFALDGPPLALAGCKLNAVAEKGRALPLALEGSMERSCMVGVGKIELRDTERGLLCTGAINSAPSEKGRIRAVLRCENSLFLMLTLSNKGPDQGVGLARFVRDASGQLPPEPGPAPAEQDATAGNNPAPPKASNFPTDSEIFKEEPLLLFYHPWDKEAARRLPEVLDGMAEALAKTARGKNAGSRP
jgi:hypothetical protein